MRIEGGTPMEVYSPVAAVVGEAGHEHHRASLLREALRGLGSGHSVGGGRRHGQGQRLALGMRLA